MSIEHSSSKALAAGLLTASLGLAALHQPHHELPESESYSVSPDIHAQDTPTQDKLAESKAADEQVAETAYIQRLADRLDTRLQAGKRISILAGVRVIGRDPLDGSKKRVVTSPIMKTVTRNGEPDVYYFGLEQTGRSLKSLRVVSPQQELEFLGDPKDSLFVNTDLKVKLNKQHQAIGKPLFGGKKQYRVGVTRDATAAQLGITSGKRFASRNAIYKIEDAATAEATQAPLQEFLDQYGVTVDVNTSPTQDPVLTKYLDYTPILEGDLATLKNNEEALIDEWAKLPPAYIRTLGITSIDIMDRAWSAGTARTRELLGAMALRGGYGIIYTNPSSAMQMRQTATHEVGHYNDEAFRKTGGDNELWTNPSGFIYGMPPQPTVDHPLGFVSLYAATGRGDDRAETFSYMITYPEKIAAWAATDPTLANKAALIKQELATLDPADMSGSYLDDINPR